jgi:hypothetical protein
MKDKTLNILISLIVVLVIGGVAYFSFSNKTEDINQIPIGLEYRNSQYRFSISLPESWKGYTVINDKWEGYNYGTEGNRVVATGPQIYIRHPLWTLAVPRQDIPIMIFTISEWNDMQADKFHIGAAPINPSELGRNAKYVFALPARYNFAYLPGFEEVDQIIKDGAIKVF